MRTFFLRMTVLVAALALLAAPGTGASSTPRSDRAVLTLNADRPRFEPREGASGLVPTIDGFGLSSRPGEPSLPVRILMVAIPEGSVPELGILGARSVLLRGIDVAPAPRVRVRDRLPEARGARKARGRDRERPLPPDILEYDEEFVPDAGIFDRDAEFPAAPVRLGRTGYLREQRFVELIFQPVQFNPRRRQARLFSEVRVEVRFGLPGAAPVERPFRPDPNFEATYAGSLANYEQGKRFRVPAGAERATGAQGAAEAQAAAEVKGSAAGGSLSAEAVAITPAFAGNAVTKVQVSAPGIYRLDYSYFNTNAPAILGYDPRTLMLRAGGVEVPISIRTAGGASGEADGAFNPGDFLEFYGLPKTEPPTILNFDLGVLIPDVFEANDFTDAQIYWLTSEGDPGTHLRIPEANAAPGAPAKPLAADFPETATWEENNLYAPLGEVDPFFSSPSLLAGSTQAQRDLGIALPGLAAASATNNVTIRIRGGSSLTEDLDHRTKVWINGNTAGAADFTWDGEVIKEQTFPVAQSVLTAASTIHVQAPGQPGISVDRQYLDSVTIGYRRTFASAGDLLTFTYPNQDARFQVSGFSGATPTIYDISRALPGGEAAPVRLTGAAVSGAPTSTYTFEVAQDTSPDAPAVRKFAVAGPAGLRTPAATGPAPAAVLTVPGNAADFIVIAARNTVDASPGGALDNLLAHRLAVQGLTSRVVYIDQIYDEFSYGLRDPNAIRAFLSYAFDNWTGPGGTAAPPSFVLLVGDATPDYKNVLLRSDYVDQVPTPIMFQVDAIIGFFSSDNWLASFRGPDQIPDLYLGRISTRTAAESAAVFNKILQYETSPPGGTWKGRAVLATSEGKVTGEADDFEELQEDLRTTYFSASPFSTPSPPLYFENAPWNATDATGFRNALISEIQGGASILSFVGHGSFSTWGLDTFFTTQDAFALTNGGRLPFMFNMNCLSGGFHFLLGSGAIGEGMVNNPNGGAIAALAPAGLSNIFIGKVVAEDLFAPILGPLKMRVLGPAAVGLRTTLWSRGSIVDLQGYTFLGDPATILAIPAPPPPAGLAALAGNGQVTLSWTPPSPAPAAYKIYRALTSPAGPYAAVPCDPLSASSCADRTVVNAKTYYYYVVSVDPEGFEGAPTNQNTDCDAGPDCVVARPINPAPPAAPTGLAAQDAGTGDRLNVSWTANGEADIKNYILHYGTVPGAYTASLTAAATATSTVLGGLTTGTRYYMALSATNTSSHESAYSAEISAVPHIIEGIAPPRAISDLVVDRSGSDLVLTWTRPTVDIYGRPTTVGGYRVYRSATPDFIPSAGTLIATLTGGALTTHTDGGAAVSPQNAFYLVTAWDASNPSLVSGAGRDLPNGIAGLLSSWVEPDTLHLDWTAVETDVQGLPTVVARYLVYTSPTPFSRTAISGMTPMDNGTALSLDLAAPESRLFVSVIAVDNRGNMSPF